MDGMAETFMGDSESVSVVAWSEGVIAERLHRVAGG
jgi:hypothetical protein